MENTDFEIYNLKLEIYSMILGYYCAEKDGDIFQLLDINTTINELNTKVQKLLNTTKPLITVKDNSLDSIRICIKQLIDSNKSEEYKYIKTLNSFIEGYEYYKFYSKKYDSIFDYILLKKHKRLEYKLFKAQEKID